MVSEQNKVIIKELLKSDTGDIYVIRDILSMAIAVENEDKKQSRKLAEKARDYAMKACSGRNGKKAFEIYNQTLLYLAKNHRDFDSYLLYIEKNRDPEEKFYQPRRNQLHFIVREMQRMIDDELDLLTISVVPGAGKAQPLYSKVLTPDGFVEMRDIHVGSKVIAGNNKGNTSTVLGVYPQGKKAIYEITLENGRKARSSADHLWRIWIDDGVYKNGRFETLTLEDAVKIGCDYEIGFPCVMAFTDEKRLNQHDGEWNLEDNHSLEIAYSNLKDIDYIGEEECQCIYIDDPSHLYITDDYIITHNTTLEEFFASFVMGLMPNKPNIFSSFSSYVTDMFYDAVLNIITNKEYCWADVFPEVPLEDKDAKATTINLGKFKPFKTLTCRAINASVTGVTRAEGYVFVDDLVSGIEEALSKDRLDLLYNKYVSNLRTRRKKGCKEIHIATRWSVHDVIGRLQRQYDGDPRASFIAVPDIDPVTGLSNFNYDYGVGFDEKYFQDIAATMDDVTYRCLYKNEPVEREGLLYHPDELRRFLSLPETEPDAILAVCDTKDIGKDYNCLQVYYQYGNDHYLVDTVYKNIDPGTLDELNANMLVAHNVQRCQFESNKEGSRTAAKVMELVKAKGGRCNITKKYSTQNKETRIIVNSAWTKEHVLFKDPSMYTLHDDYGQMMSSICQYTQLGKNSHDDACDSLAAYAMFTTQELGAKVVVTSRAMLGF